MSEGPAYGDAEAKRILERAAVIDAEHGRRLDAPALREIAAQAGISAAALDRALQEHESPAPARVPWRKRHPVLLTLAVIAAILVIFMLMRALVPPTLPLR